MQKIDVTCQGMLGAIFAAFNHVPLWIHSNDEYTKKRDMDHNLPIILCKLYTVYYTILYIQYLLHLFGLTQVSQVQRGMQMPSFLVTEHNEHTEINICTCMAFKHGPWQIQQ